MLASRMLGSRACGGRPCGGGGIIGTVAAVTHVEYSRTFPPPGREGVRPRLPVPLERILGKRYLAIPAIKTVQDRPGAELGQRRTLHFTDGGRTTEVLTSRGPTSSATDLGRPPPAR